ncbi:hypothetical protein BDV93DRAFT_524717 [Ceratobasidium sp. AG-I]|nr:hypothetical protein BDV93DRAFT_524717 [Ceratobasidium sp. AG-I]
MPRYNARPRKTRSALQKAHTKSLSSMGGPRSSATENGRAGGAPQTSTSSDYITPAVALKQKNKLFDSLKKRYKSSIQREKRAKIKIEKLQAQLDLTRKKLSESHNAQYGAENGLKILQAQADASAMEIMTLKEHISSLERHGLDTTSSLSICADGTAVKNRPHEARFIYMQFPAHGRDVPESQSREHDRSYV